jgi:riboflavin biosynthesis pyrimidine reductase
MKPYIICHMISSLDGGLHPSRWTKSADGSRSEWSSIYETWHKKLWRAIPKMTGSGRR